MASQPLPAQPWLFSCNLDLAAFGGSSLLAVALTVGHAEGKAIICS